jgi:hypothetical protein
LGVDGVAVAVDERLRFSKALGVVLGLCREHSGGVDVSIQGFACLERISAALKAGEVHMAKEATVGALLPIRRENYQARPVFASGTCKKDETAVSIIPLYRAVIDYWYMRRTKDTSREGRLLILQRMGLPTSAWQQHRCCSAMAHWMQEALLMANPG